MKLKLTFKDGTSVESNEYNLVEFIKENAESIKKGDTEIYSRRFPTVEEAVVIKCYPTIKTLKTKIPYIDKKGLDALYGSACNIEYIPMELEDFDVEYEYIIFQLDKDATNKTKSGLITSDKPVAPIGEGIVLRIGKDISEIQVGDRIWVPLEKTQYITIGKERYIATLQKFILGFER